MLPSRSIEALFTVEARLLGEQFPAHVDAVMPARPGVLRLRDTGGRLIQLVASADLRAAAAKRLQRMTEGGPPGGVVLSAAPLGDLLEAELVWFELARDEAPGEHASAIERHRTWWATIEPDAYAPFWRRRTLGDLADATSGVVFLGPMATKSAADRYCRALDERFSLCREPAILAARPSAACVYKEMGACPAPCDESESMDEFRRRVRLSAGFTPAAAARERADANARMASAAAGMNFEAAAAIKADSQVLEPFGDPAARHTDRLGSFLLVAVVPAGRAGWARVIAASERTTAHVADIAVPKGRPADHGWLTASLAAAPSWAMVTGFAGSTPTEAQLPPVALERFELFCHRLTRGPKKASARVLRLASGVDLADTDALDSFATACRSVAYPVRPRAARSRIDGTPEAVASSDD